MSYTRWSIPYDPALSPDELESAGYSPLLARVLASRGYDGRDSAAELLEAGRDMLGDPFELDGMAEAAARIKKALASGEKIAVYGDYDVDGITSTCLMTDYLRRRGANTLYYIPDRIEEGYGVNPDAVTSLAKKGVTLIITVDCGVTAVGETETARALGVDMVITDHHECREALPAALAVVDPKRPGACGKSRELAGVGVAFKLLCALDGSAGRILDEYADLVALGTIADVMPLTGENRCIVHSGLDKLARSPRPGLRALMDEAGLDARRMTATGVGFSLAPRINASGRLGKAYIAAELLLTDSPSRARELSAELCQLNRDRQELELSIWEDAVGRIGGTRPTRPIVLSSDRWHQGVIGIAASRLTEAYHVPAVMICTDGEKGKGSCRSYGGFNLFEALQSCSELLESYGGHASAAGLNIKPQNIDAFREKLGEYYDRSPGDSESVLPIDVWINSPELLDMRCVQDLDRLEPCGNSHPTAELCITGAILDSVTPIGGGKHLRMRIRKFSQSYDAVFFSKTAEELGLRAGDYVDCAFNAQINEFRQRKTVQLLMTDIRRHDLSAAEAVLDGEMPPEARAAAPSRRDFVRIWRSVVSLGGRIDRSLPAALEMLAPEMWDVRLCLCLKVFDEMGLARVGYEDARLRIECIRNAGKVDLGDSVILRTLDKLPEKELEKL